MERAPGDYSGIDIGFCYFALLDIPFWVNRALLCLDPVSLLLIGGDREWLEEGDHSEDEDFFDAIGEQTDEFKVCLPPDKKTHVSVKLVFVLYIERLLL